MPYCPQCGEEIREDDRFCIECGTALHDRQDGKRSSRRESEYGWQSEPPEGMTLDSSRSSTAEITAGRFWVPGVTGVLGVIQSLVFIVYADQAAAYLLEQNSMFQDLTKQEISSSLFSAGLFGVFVSVALIGLVGYYYTRGTLDRQYFWGLIGTGAAGVLFGGGLLFFVPGLIGVYGLVSVID